MNPTSRESFAAFKAALLAEHKAADSAKTGESTTLMLALLKLKEVNRGVSTRALEAQEACAKEKERAERLHLRLENLLYKRSHLLTEIAQSQDLQTPCTDAIAKETQKPLATRKFTKELRAKHEQVLTLLMREQMDRKTDKLALEQRRKEHEAQLTALDSKRRFVDEEMQKYIVKLSEGVQAAAQGFQGMDS
jgi:hypothetical protein